VVGTLAIMAVGDAGLSRSVFEAVSAFGTTGLSTGLSVELPRPARP
jgi:trk system potassium uptake protein TrkH